MTNRNSIASQYKAAVLTILDKEGVVEKDEPSLYYKSAAVPAVEPISGATDVVVSHTRYKGRSEDAKRVVTMETFAVSSISKALHGTSSSTTELSNFTMYVEQMDEALENAEYIESYGDGGDQSGEGTPERALLIAKALPALGK